MRPMRLGEAKLRKKDRKKPQGKNIMSAYATQAGHNKAARRCSATAHGRFNHICQVAPMCTLFGIRTVPVLLPAESLWVRISTAGYVRACPGPGPFRYRNCALTCGDLHPHLTRGSQNPPNSASRTASRSVQPFSLGLRSWQTNRPRYSVCSNRPHLRSTAMRPKILYW